MLKVVVPGRPAQSPPQGHTVGDKDRRVTTTPSRDLHRDIDGDDPPGGIDHFARRSTQGLLNQVQKIGMHFAET